MTSEAPAALSRIQLPQIPQDQRDRGVAAWAEPLVIDTYLPTEPSPYPAFLDRRVYQGSSGKVYPLPFHERIEPVKRPHEWQAVHLENDWVRLVILPELGGRVHIGYDKVADYDFFYRNNVIKPALVGLAGPWISGGVEFNWPQHHRPATFLPTDWHLEEEPDGAVTVWCGDHDPMTRMKGMHGIRLRPDSSLIEARVRLHNRTDDTQTFLWWANVAARAGDDYQSFFPVDVHQVADHAKRAVASFPAVDGHYYGVDYASRAAAAGDTADRPSPDRIDWYRNIPVPTSYMVTGTREAFFGGYDHGRDAGFVHWADPDISPGKKQWTWGNAPFGWAWDENLTDGDGPYVELMAGVFTDNQPDFSWLAPGETKSFSQFWYPIQQIGPVHHATLDVALRVDVSPVEPGRPGTAVGIGLCVTRDLARDLARELAGLTVELVTPTGDVVKTWAADPRPGAPVRLTTALDGAYQPQELTVRVLAGDRRIAEWSHPSPEPDGRADSLVPAREPAAPADVESAAELLAIARYLEQYRHATRAPEPYWREALRRDEGLVEARVRLAARLMARELYAEAEALLTEAVVRLVQWAPNPADGEAHYLLGLCLMRQGRDAEARQPLAKATWNLAWRAPAAWALARICARAGDGTAAGRYVDDVLAADPGHASATCLKVTLLRATGDGPSAASLLAELRLTDPLHQWARWLDGAPLSGDASAVLDLALELASCGDANGALEVLDHALEAARRTPLGQVNSAPVIHYHQAALLAALGREDDAIEARQRAVQVEGRYAAASRLEDVAVLRDALRAAPHDARAWSLLGSWLYDKARGADAVHAWDQAASSCPPGPDLAVVHRNLGIAAFNVTGDRAAAAAHYRVAREQAPDDGRLLYEQDQLQARLRTTDGERLAQLLAHPALVTSRDDLTIELARLLVSEGRAAEAVEILASRRFQPWEGGEGQALAAWDAAQVAIATEALEAGRPDLALRAVDAALDPPGTLGEARHPLANAATLHLMRGLAASASGDEVAARTSFEQAASFSGDFTQMSTQPHSLETVASIRALRRLGRHEEAQRLVRELADYTEELARTPAAIDYFATSLPHMLIFHDDPQVARDELVAALRQQLTDLHEASAP